MHVRASENYSARSATASAQVRPDSWRAHAPSSLAALYVLGLVTHGVTTAVEMLLEAEMVLLGPKLIE